MNDAGTEETLLAQIAALLADPAHADHPLHAPLVQLYQRHLEQQLRLDKLITISDRYQLHAQESRQATEQRYEGILRRQQKLSRISDRYQKLMRERNQALLQASTHDPLTELPNRRLINDRLRQLTRRQRPFSLALLDIDHFKWVNDRYGHDIGDSLLVAITSAMGQSLRRYDLCGRWGGEEFLLVLADTGLDEAGEIVERLTSR
jgi:diguanylate cyclase